MVVKWEETQAPHRCLTNLKPNLATIMPRWTTEARLRQAERIRALCPWNKATGPRTEEGKARSSRNAWKGGVRALVATCSQTLRAMGAATQRVFSSFRPKPVSRPRRTLAPKLAPREASFSELAMGFPPDPTTGRHSKADLIAMAGRLLEGEGLLEGGLFSSFG